MEPTCELYDDATGLASAGLTATTYDAPSNVASVTLGALGETAVKAVACPKNPNELDPSDALAGKVYSHTQRERERERERDTHTETRARSHTHAHAHQYRIPIPLRVRALISKRGE